MKKQIIIPGLALLSAVSQAPARMSIFEEMDRMVASMHRNMEQMRRMSDLQVAAKPQEADYTLQTYTEGGKYGVLVKLNGAYAKQAPMVEITSGRDERGRATKELEIKAQSAVPAKKGAAPEATYSCFTQSSTLMMRDGVVTQQTSESSKASAKDGVLCIVHALPKSVDDRNYTMTFNEEEGQLKLEFALLELQPKPERKALSYTSDAPRQEEDEASTEK